MADEEKNYKLIIDDEVYETRLTAKYRRRKPYAPKDPNRILAVIPGVILSISVKPGSRVACADSLLVVEAMKMKNDIFAPHDGTIKTVHIKPGDITSKNQLLIEMA